MQGQTVVTDSSGFSDKDAANEACSETANKETMDQFHHLKSSNALTEIFRKIQANT